MEDKIKEGYTLLVKKTAHGLTGIIVKKDEDSLKREIIRKEELSYFDILPAVKDLLDEGKIIRVYSKANGFINFQIGLKKEGAMYYNSDYLEVLTEGRSAFFMQALFNLENNIIKMSNTIEKRKIYQKNNK